MHEDSHPNTVDSGPRMSPDGLLVGDVNLHEHSELCCAGSDAASITADTPPATDARRTRHQEPHRQMRTIGRVLRTPAHNRHDAELMLAKDADHGDSDFGFFR